MLEIKESIWTFKSLYNLCKCIPYDKFSFVLSSKLHRISRVFMLCIENMKFVP